MTDDDFMLGHNMPPEPTVLDRCREIIAAANAGIRSIKVIDNEEVAGRCQGFVSQLRETQADLEAARKAEIDPLQAAMAAIREKYVDPLALITLARAALQPLLDDWLERKRIKLADEKAKQQADAVAAQAAADRLRRNAEQAEATLQQRLEARRAQERADALADTASKPVQRAQIKGEFNPERAMSQRPQWRAEITDAALAAAVYASRPEVIEALTKAASADARRLKDTAAAPPGVRFIETRRAV